MQKIADDGSLTKKQLLAIVELCNPANRRISDVANKIGVGERTLFTWLKLPHFKEKLQIEKETLRRESLDTLKSTLLEAVTALRLLLQSENEGIKLKAALAVIEFNLEIADLENLEQRITALETVENNEYA